MQPFPPPPTLSQGTGSGQVPLDVIPSKVNLVGPILPNRAVLKPPRPPIYARATRNNVTIVISECDQYHAKGRDKSHSLRTARLLV